MKANLLIRNDPAGEGHFGASRGSRTHRGLDYQCCLGQQILAPCHGTVTRIGYPYAGDLSWKYVEILCHETKEHHRVFYISPLVVVGDKVMWDETAIGLARDISTKYPDQGMLPHIHYEIKKGQEYLDPTYR